MKAANDDVAHVTVQPCIADPDSVWVTVSFPCPKTLEKIVVDTMKLSIETMTNNLD